MIRYHRDQKLLASALLYRRNRIRFMETGNQQAGYGRSRGKWNKRKQQERLAQKESQKLVEPQKQ